MANNRPIIDQQRSMKWRYKSKYVTGKLFPHLCRIIFKTYDQTTQKAEVNNETKYQMC